MNPDYDTRTEQPVRVSFFAASAARRLLLALLGAALALALALLVPGSASAAFTRPFIRQVAESGSLGVDSEDHLWVGQDGPPPFRLDEFSSAELGNSSLGSLSIEEGPPNIFENPNHELIDLGLTPPHSIAFEDSTDSFYLASARTSTNNAASSVEAFDKTGAFLARFAQPLSGGFVAFDNSTDPSDPSAGSLYVVVEGDGGGIYRLNASGEPVEYSGSAPYTQANKITGTPNGAFSIGAPVSIALDPKGDIYVAMRNYIESQSASAVVEYAPSGEFLRAFTGGETPGLGGSSQEGGFGGGLAGVAIDSSLGGHPHLLVSLASLGPIEAGAEGAGHGAVDEFDASSGRFLSQISEASQGQLLRGSSAITVDSHGNLYVFDSGSTGGGIQAHAIDVYGPGHFLPSFRLADVSQSKPTSAVLNGFVNPEALVNPEGAGLDECDFEYVTQAAFKATGFTDLSSGGSEPCLPAAGSIPADSSYHPVHADATGLTSGTTYRYRLLATTSGGLGGTGTSGALAFTAPHAPAIDSSSAENISSAFADVRALINPLGADTSYQFQYVEEAHYEPAAGNPYAAGQTVPATPAEIGSGSPTGSADASVRQQLGGLSPGTLYHFRVVALNEVGASEGPDQTFTTLARVSPGLPDHRAYELVTPPDKGSAVDMFGGLEEAPNLFVNSERGYASESGDAFLLTTTLAAFGPFPASEHNAYLFSRGADGWQANSLASPGLGVQSLHNDIFNPTDFSQVGINDLSGSYSSPAGAALTTLLGPPGGPYATLHADAPLHGTSGEAEETEQTRLVGGSQDLSHVVLEGKSHTLIPGGPAEAQNAGTHALYEAANGKLTLINVNSKGALLGKCGAVLGHSEVEGNRHNAVSADGNRVFFTAPDPYAKNAEGTAGCWNGATVNAPQLYMRSGSTTTELSAPAKNAPEGAAHLHPAVFVGASDDGTRVFFVTESELTEDDAGIHDPELYEYDTETSTLTRVSRGESGNAAAAVAYVLAVSADGSAVYFSASGSLTGNAPTTSGEDVNLYRYGTGTGTTAYVATLERRDYSKEATNGWGEELALTPNKDFYTTPDGRYLLFATTRELTGYATHEASPGDCPSFAGTSPNGRCYEVYRYDSTAGALACLSCDPAGAPPTSNAEFGRNAGSETDPAAPPVRAMSDDGSYAFFDTADALVPRDGNGTFDVYEWHEGALSLISSGQDFAPSFFLGASSDGADVFFGTHARLVPADTDTAGDLYDARIDGGFPPPGSGLGPCEGDACSTPPSPPAEPTLASSVSSGPGNAHQGRSKARCARGKVLSHGKCVKKHRKSKHKRTANSDGRGVR